MAWQDLPRELYLLGALLATYGVALLALTVVGRDNGFAQVMTDIYAMPLAMRRLDRIHHAELEALRRSGAPREG